MSSAAPTRTSRIFIFVTIAAGLVAGVSLSPGQETTKPEPQSRTLRVLPLGDSPPFRQEIRDGVRYELEPPPGSVPPRQLAFGAPEAGLTIRLNLGRVSEPVPIPGGASPFSFRLPDNDETAQPWLRVSLPETGSQLALVWRDPGSSWDRPRSILIPESAQAFPEGSLRLVNLTAAPIAAIVGDDRVPLSPGQVVVKPIQVGGDVPVQLAYTDASGAIHRFHSSSVLLNNGERGQLIIHRADGEKPRHPLKVITLNERLP
jgi:hypothetical protein